MGSLRALAESDLVTTLESDFGVTVTVTDPNGQCAEVQGQSSDIGVSIDPDTGVPISGRRAHVTLRLASLVAAGFDDIPQHVTSADGHPWRIEFTDSAGVAHVFAIRHSWPDRSLGIVTLLLEYWSA